MSAASNDPYEPRILYSIYYPYETVPTIHLYVLKTQPFEIQTANGTLIDQGLHNIVFINNKKTSKLTPKTAENELSNSKGVVLTFMRRLTPEEKRTNADPEVRLPKDNTIKVLEFLEGYNANEYNGTHQLIEERTPPALSPTPIARGSIQGSQSPKSSPRPEGQTSIHGTPKPRGGKKSTTRRRKQKTRKQKSRKQKSRKQKSRKQKTRKQKTRKH